MQRFVRLSAGFLCAFFCLLAPVPLPADEWPQWRGPNRDGVWREKGIVQKFANERIKLRWRQPIASGYCGPTVADGRVYVADRLVEPQQTERVHCFDWETGKKIWSHEYPRDYHIGYTAGPRASITIDDGRAYALGAMGDLHCFDAASGKVLWKRDLLAEYKIRMPIWGIASAPLIEGDVVVLQIGGQNACLVGLDKKTGEERWTALDDRASYAAPIMIQQAGKRVMVCWTGDSVVGMNAVTGDVYWRHPFTPSRMVIGIATPVVDDNRLFVTSFYSGSLMLRLKPDELAVEQMWRRKGDSERQTDALHSIMATPLLQGKHLYGVDSYGELRCLEAATGDRVWEDKTATLPARWSNIHMVRNGDKIWMFNEAGELIISQLSPQGFHEISRAKLIEPTRDQLPSRRGRTQLGVCWSHPAYAYRHVFARNDREIVCASLAE